MHICHHLQVGDEKLHIQCEEMQNSFQKSPVLIHSQHNHTLQEGEVVVSSAVFVLVSPGPPHACRLLEIIFAFHTELCALQGCWCICNYTIIGLSFLMNWSMIIFGVLWVSCACLLVGS